MCMCLRISTCMYTCYLLYVCVTHWRASFQVTFGSRQRVNAPLSQFRVPFRPSMLHNNIQIYIYIYIYICIHTHIHQLII